jgi:hypothetical protein
MMLTEPDFSQHLLIPLTPLPTGAQYYVAAVRKERLLKMVQCRVEITPAGVHACIRAIAIPDELKSAYPHITFVTEKVKQFKFMCLFWNALNRHSQQPYNRISLLNPG